LRRLPIVTTACCLLVARRRAFSAATIKSSMHLRRKRYSRDFAEIFPGMTPEWA
jgi:hypothetical protein